MQNTNVQWPLVQRLDQQRLSKRMSSSSLAAQAHTHLATPMPIKCLYVALGLFPFLTALRLVTVAVVPFFFLSSAGAGYGWRQHWV